MLSREVVWSRLCEQAGALKRQVDSDHRDHRIAVLPPGEAAPLVRIRIGKAGLPPKLVIIDLRLRQLREVTLVASITEQGGELAPDRTALVGLPDEVFAVLDADTPGTFQLMSLGDDPPRVIPESDAATYFYRYAEARLARL